MQAVRISKSVERALAAKKLREIELRKKYNRNADAKRRERGHIRFEKTVPDPFRDKLRGIVEAVIAMHQGGHDVQLTRHKKSVECVPSFPHSATEVDEEHPAESGSQAGASQRQVTSRSRQNERRRARARQAGRRRATFEIPIELRAEISAILDRAIEDFFNGFDVTVTPVLLDQVADLAQSDHEPPTVPASSLVAPAQACMGGTLSVRSALPSQADELCQTNENQLFWDIQALKNS